MDIPKEVGNRFYCKDNGMYCQFMDPESGYCIATTCRQAMNWLQQDEIDRQAAYNMELENGRLDIKESRIARTLAQFAAYGATMIDLGNTDGEDILEEVLE